MYLFFKRSFDICSSLSVLLLLFPFLLITGLIVLLTSPGGMFYKQIRVGKNGKEFKLLKFRSMRENADQGGQITIGEDSRVTNFGKFIRKYKVDEFPQLWNIIKGDMSLVGPRPEVPKYVALYTEQQKRVLTVLPGLTDYATLVYINEQTLLGQAADPEKAYIETVMPDKLSLNLKYLDERSFFLDFRLVLKTIVKIL